MNEKIVEERLLIERACGGDREACGELIARHQDLIYNSIVYMVGDADDAEDLAQIVFLKAIRNLDSFQGRAKLSTWLYSIMVNTVRSFWRDKKSGGNPVSLDGSQDQGEQGRPLKVSLRARGDEPWEALTAKENVELVRAAIAGLKDGYREIVVLRDIEGLSYRRLASVLGISTGTVKSRLSRARDALQQELERLMEGK